ncbi:MAG: DUF262 domain-containing protein [Bacteroidales bacterium]|nr:DUF262 domain-containing protein [Bacteroidales bacterium]
MTNQTETIRKFVGYINNKDFLGGFWLPNIQRHFVWSEEQIARLYDSILREYPIGSFLIWKTKSDIKHRKFIDNWKDSIRIMDFYVPENGNAKMLVLDGQQRIQSLLIGLNGSYNGKELHFNILSGDLKSPEDVRYEFSFMDNSIFPWIKFKQIVTSDKKNRDIKKDLLQSANLTLPTDQDDRLEENIELIRNVFCIQENIAYQIIDSVDRPESYTDDDIVEIFIRANSGGTTLNKSDLMFSLLINSWEEADENMSDLLDELNRTGYKFNRDFIIKTCLVLLNQGARYNVDKLRDETVRQGILDQWEDIIKSLKKVKDFVYGNTFLKTDKTIPSYLSLIPLIYFSFHYQDKWAKNLKEYDKYLIRTSLTGSFGGTPDNLLDKIVKQMNEDQDFILSNIFGSIREVNRSLEVSKETILGLNYWKKELHLFFNLWYGFNYQPSLQNNYPAVDHIFPQSVLKRIKEPNPETGRLNIMKYKWQDRDQIGNLMLLTAEENGGGGKTAIIPEIWFANKSEEYLELHLIPKDKNLWKVDNFEAFIEARKELILQKFDYLIIKA